MAGAWRIGGSTRRSNRNRPGLVARGGAAPRPGVRRPDPPASLSKAETGLTSRHDQPGGRHGAPVAPQPVLSQPRPPRGVVAASELVAAAADRYPLLPGSGAQGGSGEIRLDLPGRSAGARRRRGAGGGHLARTDYGAGRAGGVDQPYRPDRDLLDDLHRTLQP